MFWKKKCRNCSEVIKTEWNFCPNCGENLVRKSVDGIFEDVEKELEKIDKRFKTDFKMPRFKLKPSTGSGINITITSGGGMPPRVEVRQSGMPRKHEHQHKHRVSVGTPYVPETKPAREFKAPKNTEEPETEIKKVGNKQVIKVSLPEVKEEDVEIKQLEQSIEIRAIAGDKVYFKLIPVPTNAYVDKEFKNGVLKLEVMK